MSIAYNKKYKGQILRQDNDNKIIEQQKEKQLFTPKKNSTNTKFVSSNQVPLKFQQGQKTKVKSSQYKEPQSNYINNKINQEDQDDYQEQNKQKNTKNINMQKKPIRENNKKTIPKTKTANLKLKTEFQNNSQDENRSEMSTESNNRNKDYYPSNKRNHTVQPKSKSNTRSLNKQTTQQQQSKLKKMTSKQNTNKYIFYNNKKKTEPKEESIEENQQSDNQFIDKINQKHKQLKYKKNVHLKGEDKKQRLKNKLGFIFDLVNQDQIASVSYYSQSDSVKQTPSNYPPPQKKQLSKQIENKPYKQGNFQKNNKLKQKKQDKKSDKINKFQIKLQQVNIQKPIRIYQTPKRLERKISSNETIKKEPVFIYQSTYKQINPQNNRKVYQNNDDELMAIIKKNDQYLDNFKIEKYPKHYFQSYKKTHINPKLKLSLQNRRIKTELDHRNDDFSPLSEEQMATLARLKAREELLMKKIKYQFYFNPSSLYTNDSSIQEEPVHSYQDPNNTKQLTPSSNTYEISRVLPILNQTFRPKKSEVLQNYPLSLKNYQKPNYFNNKMYLQNYNNEIQTQKSIQNHTQQVNYNRGKSNKQSNFKNLYLFSSRNDKDYKIRNPRQKYQKIKNLLKRV